MVVYENVPFTPVIPEDTIAPELSFFMEMFAPLIASFCGEVSCRDAVNVTS